MRMRVVEKATDDSRGGSQSLTKDEIERNLRILIVEDNLTNQKVVVGLLSQIPCQCEVVENGAEAVAALMRSPYDVVFMDIQMPVMDGVTATQEIRSLGGEVSGVPIIAITADAMQGDREKHLAAGMDDYVAKPINSESLFAAISRCTGRPALNSQVRATDAVA
jgi:CheY-like chemotaxis protein